MRIVSGGKRQPTARMEGLTSIPDPILRRQNLWNQYHRSISGFLIPMLWPPPLPVFYPALPGTSLPGTPLGCYAGL